jgi:hypothetical protein
MQIEYVPTVVRVHYVPEYQLEGLATGGATVNLGLAGMTFGAAVTIIVTLVTVDMGAYAFASFVAALIATSGLTAFFGSAAYRDHQKARRQLDAIKAGKPIFPAGTAQPSS